MLNFRNETSEINQLEISQSEISQSEIDQAVIRWIRARSPRIRSGLVKERYFTNQINHNNHFGHSSQHELLTFSGINLSAHPRRESGFFLFAVHEKHDKRAKSLSPKEKPRPT